MEELTTHINNYFGLKNDSVKKIEELFKKEYIIKGNLHTRQGQYNTSLSFVKKGFLRVCAPFDGKEITQWIAKDGEFVADLSGLMFGQPARWDIQAITDCELFTIHASDYQRINEILSEWAQLEKAFLARCFAVLEDRVFSFLSMSAEERYHKMLEERAVLFNQIPLQYIASMLGMTPETFSRIRKKMSS